MTGIERCTRQVFVDQQGHTVFVTQGAPDQMYDKDRPIDINGREYIIHTSYCQDDIYVIQVQR